MSHPKQTTPPSSGDGGKPVACATATCPKCCGCIASASISNITSYNDGGRFGHNFDFTIQMDFTAGISGVQDCTLEWWEKTNIPAVPGAVADAWTELFAVYSVSPTFDPWTNRTVPCPGGGHLAVTITDVPGLGIRPGRTAKRTLQFRLVVRSGPGCSCANASQTATATQVLEIINGVPAGTNSLITP